MASSDYPYIDIAALAAVRRRFAAGDQMLILSQDLEDVLWANGPGAALLGFATIEALFSAGAKLPLAARRQIAATPGFPAIGLERTILVRLAAGGASRLVAFAARSLALPDGAPALLLAAPAAQSA